MKLNDKTIEIRLILPSILEARYDEGMAQNSSILKHRNVEKFEFN